MNIQQLQRIRSVGLGSADQGRALPQARDAAQAGSPRFSEALEQAVDKVDGAQKSAESQMSAFVAGEQENLHEVMISMNEAKLSLQLMTEVRNKMLETYQELMRMQV